MDKIKKMSLVALVLLLVGIVGSLLTFRPVFRQEAKLEEKVIHEKFSRIKIATDNTRVEILPAAGSAAKSQYQAGPKKVQPITCLLM